MAEIVFWIIAALTIMSAAFVVLNNQLIYSAVALLFTLFGVAGIYVFLWADFIAGIQILVYVGGILVLVIFGIMLTNKIKSVRISHKSMQQGVGGVVSFWFFIFNHHLLNGFKYFLWSFSIGMDLTNVYLATYIILSANLSIGYIMKM